MLDDDGVVSLPWFVSDVKKRISLNHIFPAKFKIFLSDALR
jgi:hypothetical protein